MQRIRNLGDAEKLNAHTDNGPWLLPILTNLSHDPTWFHVRPCCLLPLLLPE